MSIYGQRQSCRFRTAQQRWYGVYAEPYHRKQCDDPDGEQHCRAGELYGEPNRKIRNKDRHYVVSAGHRHAQLHAFKRRFGSIGPGNIECNECVRATRERLHGHRSSGRFRAAIRAELLDRVANRRDLEVTLHRLADADLLSCHGLPPRSSYLFKHSLVQDVAYSTLLRTRRQELHARVALVLSEYFTDLVDHQPELVAHHLTAAGDNERAIDQWLKAGQLAASRSANLEAIAHLQRGIQAIRAFPDGTKDRTELKLLYTLGPCVIATQGPISDMARETFARARALCERVDSAPEHLNVLYWLAVAHGLRGELSQAAEATEAGIALAEARDDRPALINSLRGAALAHLLTGHLDKAQDRCQRAVEIFNASDEVEQLATLVRLGKTLAWRASHSCLGHCGRPVTPMRPWRE